MLRNIRKNTVKHCINCILGAACGPLWASSGSRLGVCGSPLGLCWASGGPLWASSGLCCASVGLRWASGGLRGESGELRGTSGGALGGYVGLSGSLLGFRWASGGLKGGSGGRKTRVNYTETPETRKNTYINCIPGLMPARTRLQIHTKKTKCYFTFARENMYKSHTRENT